MQVVLCIFNMDL